MLYTWREKSIFINTIVEGCMTYLIFVSPMTKWCHKHVINPFISSFRTNPITCKLPLKSSKKEFSQSNFLKMYRSKWNMPSCTLSNRGTGSAHGTVTCWSTSTSTSFKKWFQAFSMFFNVCQVSQNNIWVQWKWIDVWRNLSTFIFPSFLVMRWTWYTWTNYL